MSKAGFSIYDFTTSSLKATLDNVRLLVLSMLVVIGGMFAAVLGMLIIVSPTIMKFWNIMPSIKQSMATIATLDKIAQTQVMTQIWLQVTPLFTTLDSVLFVLGALFFLLVMISMIVGFLRLTLDVVDHGSSTVSRIISCFHYAPRFFIATFFSLILIGVGLMLFIIPGVILTLRLRFFSYYIIDKNMGAITSLKASYHATKGFEWEILGLNIVAAVLTVVAPIIGIPVSCFMLAYAYRALPTI